MSTTTEECGCKHNGTRWLLFCEKHQRDLEELRQRAHEQRNGIPEFTPVNPWD